MALFYVKTCTVQKKSAGEVVQTLCCQPKQEAQELKPREGATRQEHHFEALQQGPGPQISREYFNIFTPSKGPNSENDKQTEPLDRTHQLHQQSIRSVLFPL